MTPIKKTVKIQSPYSASDGTPMSMNWPEGMVFPPQRYTQVEKEIIAVREFVEFVLSALADGRTIRFIKDPFGGLEEFRDIWIAERLEK
jgi:hypothetical protein